MVDPGAAVPRSTNVWADARSRSASADTVSADATPAIDRLRATPMAADRRTTLGIRALPVRARWMARAAYQERWGVSSGPGMGARSHSLTGRAPLRYRCPESPNPGREARA